MQSDAQPSRPTGPSLLSLTGPLYFPLAFIARLPFAMGVVGVLTLIVSVRGSVEIAGFGSAMVGIGSACFGPLIGAAADRYGQRPTLLVSAAVNSVMLGVLAWITYSDAPTAGVFVAAFLVGASCPQPSPMSRSRLVTIIGAQLPPQRRPRTISSVLAYESAADEVIFVFGPVIVGLLASTLGAWAPIAGAAILTLVFITAFALHRTAVASQSAEERAAKLAPASQLARPRLLVVVFGIFCVGLTFGTTLTSLTAFMQDLGRAESAGLFYGIMGIGSAILAISVALFSPRFTLRYRWLAFAGIITAGQLVLAGSTGLGQVALGLALTGIGIGPLLVTLYGLGSARSPEGRSATVMTMLGSAIMLGQSLSAAVAGLVAEQLGASSALALPAMAGGLALLTGAANWALTPSGRRER